MSRSHEFAQKLRLFDVNMGAAGIKSVLGVVSKGREMKVGDKVQTMGRDKTPVVSKDIIVVGTDNMGLCTFAGEPIRSGEIAAFYCGEVLTDENLMGDALEKMVTTHFLSARQAAARNLIIDGRPRSDTKYTLEYLLKNGTASLASSKMKGANCKLVVYPKTWDTVEYAIPEVGEPMKMGVLPFYAMLVATQDIEEGEEVNWKYNLKDVYKGSKGKPTKRINEADRITHFPMELLEKKQDGEFTYFVTGSGAAHAGASVSAPKVIVKLERKDTVVLDSEDEKKEDKRDDEDEESEDKESEDEESDADENKGEKNANGNDATLDAIAAVGVPPEMVQAFGNFFKMITGSGPATKNPRGILKNKTPDQAGPDLSSKKRKTNELEASDETGVPQPQKAFKVQIEDLNAELTEKNQKIAELEANIVKLSAEKEDLQKQYDALMPRFGSLAGFIQHLHDETGKMMNITNAAKKT